MKILKFACFSSGSLAFRQLVHRVRERLAPEAGSRCEDSRRQMEDVRYWVKRLLQQGRRPENRMGVREKSSGRRGVASRVKPRSVFWYLQSDRAALIPSVDADLRNGERERIRFSLTFESLPAAVAAAAAEAMTYLTCAKDDKGEVDERAVCSFEAREYRWISQSGRSGGGPAKRSRSTHANQQLTATACPSCGESVDPISTSTCTQVGQFHKRERRTREETVHWR